ncbi:MAG TPA: NAD(P)-dependent oxidoreductase [Fuerstia sp.]|nr:NAD(P)-dependent oxidoreductase [Fuerstiella sp.]
MPDQTTCLIIGGNGFVGSGIRDAARDCGWDVSVADHTSYVSFAGQTFDIVINANGNAKRFHADRDPLFDFDASAASVYKSLFDFPCSKFALISTVDVYNRPDHRQTTQEDTAIDPLPLGPYAFHKWLAERFVMRHQTPWQVFRLAQMVGTGLRKGPIFDLLHGQPLWIHNESRLHYMNTRQIGAAICALIEHAPANEVYNVCGRGSVEFQAVLDLFPQDRHPARENCARQCYNVDTSRTQQWYALPDSWNEVRAFVEESLRNKPDLRD